MCNESILHRASLFVYSTAAAVIAALSGALCYDGRRGQHVKGVGSGHMYFGIFPMDPYNNRWRLLVKSELDLSKVHSHVH